MNQPPLNPGAVDRVAKALMDDAGYTWGHATEKFRDGFRHHARVALAVAHPESEDERIPAWHEVANHPAFNDCYEEERPLLESMLDHLTGLTAQPAVNSVEELDVMPHETVIRDRKDFVFERIVQHGKDPEWWSTTDFLNETKVTLPARVLYRPEVDDA